MHNKRKKSSLAALSLVCSILFSLCHRYAVLSESMKEKVSSYLCNPCSLNKERDAVFAAKLLSLTKGDSSVENLRRCRIHYIKSD